MRTCEQISGMVSIADEKGLSLRDRIEVRLHLMMCKFCARYAKQLKFLTRIMKTLPHQIDNIEKPDLILTIDARERIKKSIE